MSDETKPVVVCVDDEANVLEALKITLRRHCTLSCFTSPVAALEALPTLGDVAVIISDMRMPVMNGAEFLAKSRAFAPEAVRLLFTGQTDLESAIIAVNEGQIFRFLQKPAPPPLLISVVQAAAYQHRLLTAERVLLEQTLHGSIKALCEVLALTKPLSFGRATRVKQLAAQLAERLGLKDRWQIEVAAMLSHLGSVVLPDEVAEKLYYGKPLTPAEEKMVQGAPAAAEQLIASIPRLETVRALMRLAVAGKPSAVDDPLAEAGAVLRVTGEFERLTTSGTSAEVALAELLRRKEYDAPLVTALGEVVHAEAGAVAEMKLEALRVGMVFAEDVKMTSGSVLVTRGFSVTPNFLERIRNFQPGVVREPLFILVRGAKQALVA